MESEASPELLSELTNTALEVRRDILRRASRTGDSHLGGSLSTADLVTALVFHELNLDPNQTERADRDRLVLSNAGASTAVQAALTRRGYRPTEPRGEAGPPGGRNEDFPEGPTRPWVDAHSGGVGEGIGIAVGLALDARIAGRSNRVYALIGGDESASGPTWEGLLAVGRYGLDNLVAIFEFNGPKSSTPTGAVEGAESMVTKLTAFRFETVEVDGHDFGEILRAFARAKEVKGRPTAIVARTVHGKGVLSMESAPGQTRGSPTRAMLESALAELGGSLE
jgi:transketolase